MDYKEFENTIVDYLSENLSSEKRAEFELFLENNTEFQKEFETTKLFWNADAEEMPEPTSKMDMDFYSMLKAEENTIVSNIVDSFAIQLFNEHIADGCQCGLTLSDCQFITTNRLTASN